jgi:ribosomal protein S12 methylthiotransferase accessory factor YcaO
MIDITKLHIHWRDHSGTPHKKSIKPTDATNTLMLKKDVAEFVSTIKQKAEYYYVVVEIDRGGKPAFRTIIPKTLLSA